MSWTPLYANKQRKQDMTHDEGSWTDEQNIIFIWKYLHVVFSIQH